MDEAGTLGLATIGCGGFGRFALEHFVEVPGVRVIAVAEAKSDAARRAARLLGVGGPITIEAALSRGDVDLVYVNTPPHLHHRHALAALRAGKHVLVEKPLALSLEQADALIDEARRRGLHLGVNQMQRHAALVEAVDVLIAEGLLGDLLAADLWNCASDEELPPEHWFWDRERSGGIFVEHAVHFFDVFRAWCDEAYGAGRVVSAHRARRPGTELEEHVECTVRHGDRLLVRQMHSFTQSGRLDRQQWRLLFERGDVLLEEWIPTRARVHALVDEEAVRRLRALFDRCRLEVVRWDPPAETRARGRRFEVWEEVFLHVGEGVPKPAVYGDALRSWFRDQLAAVRDPSHRPRVTAEDGREALKRALAARRAADAEGGAAQGKEGWSG